MRIPRVWFRSSACLVAGLMLTSMASAQNTGWRRFDEPAQGQVSQVAANQAPPANPQISADPSTPVARVEQDTLPPAAAQPPAFPPAPGQPGAFPGAGIPSRLTIQAGTFVTVRTNQPLSSDRNHVGDFFSATLAEPLVVDGVVVAHRGQTLSGRVAEADKGGRVKGVAKLGVQLTELTAADGQQVPIQTQFVGRDARSTAGRDVAAVATTTGLGAAVGAAADWGTGAAIGAGAGAVAGLAGVLLSHGTPAVIYPESLLTFRIEAPVTIATDRAPQAFRYVDANDYQQPNVQYRAAGPGPRPAPYYAPYGYPPYPYPYYYSPYYYGPGFGVFIGPGFYRGGYYRGFRR